MPPRYAYWTILVDDQPTAFRSSMQDELQPTFNRLKEKHPSARLVWFQNGKIWNSRVEAQEAMRDRGERGRAGDFRQRQTERKEGRSRDFREREAPIERRDAEGKLEWKPKGTFVPSEGSRTERSSPDWNPKGTGRAEGPSRRSAQREGGKPKGKFAAEGRREWKPKGKFAGEGRADWKPKKKFDTGDRPEWKPKPSGPPKDRKFAAEGRQPEWRPKSAPRQKLEWKPKGTGPADGRSRRSAASPPKPEGRRSEREGGRPKGHGDAETRSAPEKRKWIPKEEYQKSQGVEARRDKNWRPGGAHKDPRQKYKDAKKAKWGRFKQTIRKRWESKQTRKKKD